MRISRYFLVTFFVGFLLFSSCSKDEIIIPLMAEDGEELSGGDNTSNNFSAEAFGFASPDLTFHERVTFGVGNSLFNQSWVTAPASTTARDGLGPLFNARNCSGCHFKDGRGRPPEFDGEFSHGLLLRFGLLEKDENGENIGDPIYGKQFQDNSILSIEKEGTLIVSYEPLVVTYDDGTQVTLRKPEYGFSGLNYGEINAMTRISPRVANQMIGLGLLDAIPETTLNSFADPNDADGDGISGRTNKVFDRATNTVKVGRFGWKANQPNIKQQVAAAFAGDLGITSSLFPEENCVSTLDCDSLPNGGSPEIPDTNLNKVTFYAATLAVPARRDVDDENVLEGKEIFNSINCIACHIPKIETGSYDITSLANQTIRPYTDLLLHDMGEGLADNLPDFDAAGNEWRTPPLWGIGLIETVNSHTNLLHDGRARNIEEAILWHGGEALNAQTKFKALPQDERSKLIQFLNTL
ncbi:di-heme oxidoredictase family protein [Maribacter sp. ACAM166]|uniref:di-heme oxidoreductase family protein n=1 Tax=Maribacter sp. ACAM166 TaxID=2508996 RepID=UPI0010FE67CB|nr:di-heme oxidoredictase family protein [Maribacter sp. ACAM166]TLP81879.1 c-type cytochrome [Maribacter sp. ACAM166]